MEVQSGLHSGEPSGVQSGEPSGVQTQWVLGSEEGRELVSSEEGRALGSSEAGREQGSSEEEREAQLEGPCACCIHQLLSAGYMQVNAAALAEIKWPFVDLVLYAPSGIWQ